MVIRDTMVTDSATIGMDVRETPTNELMDEFEELQARIEWVHDELQFRFHHERLLQENGQENEIAGMLNEYEE